MKRTSIQQKTPYHHKFVFQIGFCIRELTEIKQQEKKTLLAYHVLDNTSKMLLEEIGLHDYFLFCSKKNKTSQQTSNKT